LANIPLFFDTGQNQQGNSHTRVFALCQMCGMGVLTAGTSSLSGSGGRAVFLTETD
jgi:hypothetical protein